MVLPFFVSQYFFAADENNNNEVVVQVLQLLAMLIKFGKYGKVDGILPAIFKLLNGKEDYPTANIKNSRKCKNINIISYAMKPLT